MLPSVLLQVLTLPKRPFTAGMALKQRWQALSDLQSHPHIELWQSSFPKINLSHISDMVDKSDLSYFLLFGNWVGCRWKITFVYAQRVRTGHASLNLVKQCGIEGSSVMIRHLDGTHTSWHVHITIYLYHYILLSTENIFSTTALGSITSQPAMCSWKMRLEIWVGLSHINHFLFCRVTVTTSTSGLSLKMYIISH